MGPWAAPALPALIKALQDEYWVVRSTMVQALGEIGPAAAPAAPALAAALENDEDSIVRSNAAKALGKIQSPTAIPALIAALDSDDDYVRLGAIAALEIFDPEAAPRVGISQQSRVFEINLSFRVGRGNDRVLECPPPIGIGPHGGEHFPRNDERPQHPSLDSVLTLQRMLFQPTGQGLQLIGQRVLFQPFGKRGELLPIRILASQFAALQSDLVIAWSIQPIHFIFGPLHRRSSVRTGHIHSQTPSNYKEWMSN